MRTTSKSHTTTVFLDGRIDTNNAARIEKEKFDTENLEYMPKKTNILPQNYSALKRRKLTSVLLALLISQSALTACADKSAPKKEPDSSSNVTTESITESTEKEPDSSQSDTTDTNVSRLSLSEPTVTEDASLPGNTRTEWDCLYFGSYPTAEIVKGDFSAVADYACSAEDIVFDAALFDRLVSADWKGDDTELDGVKYRRIRYSGTEGGMNAVHAESREQHYKWSDTDSWHYFRYEPIKWRVIGLDGGTVELMADRQLDCEPYNQKAEDIYWENCTLRSFLNGYGSGMNNDGADYSGEEKDSFYEIAFSDEERKALVRSSCENPDNYYFGTACGQATEDYVYIPDERDIFLTDEAQQHGFAKSDATDDAARRFKPTMYAMAKGAWYSPVETNKGNGFWLVRTCGYTPANVNYICDFGAVYNRGTYVTTNDSGIIPVIKIDLNKANAEYAGKVSSADIFIPKSADSNTSKRDDIPQSDGITSTDTYSEPKVVPDDSLSSGQKTTWECVYYGEYPTSEIVGSEFTAVADYAIHEGDVILDAELYNKLSAAEWKDNKTELDGERYARLSFSDTELNSTDSPQHYKWDSADAYHYFRYEPIKWRVIECDGENVMLLADRALDCKAYNDSAVEAAWESCTLRSFLNSCGADMNGEGKDFSGNGFLNTAFSDEEKSHIIAKKLANPDNINYGTDCGGSTEDKIFILSCDDIFSSPLAADHGFYAGNGVDDPAKRFRPTMYAMARGTWYSPVEDYKGNNFWFMRTNGYTGANAAYICDFGYIYSRGTNVTCNDAGILPAMWVNTKGKELRSAGRVSCGAG